MLVLRYLSVIKTKSNKMEYTSDKQTLKQMNFCGLSYQTLVPSYAQGASQSSSVHHVVFYIIFVPIVDLPVLSITLLFFFWSYKKWYKSRSFLHLFSNI